jgi:xanthine dehydrogenase YagS FAD-binding subunit
MKNNVMSDVRIALGGVGTVPWRVPEAERVLSGAQPANAVFMQAAEIALANARPHPLNRFKVQLAQRTIVRALQTVAGIE